MPKIIENVRENLLKEARLQIMERGYSAMTIRSVASACGVGVGTVYNYFSSKDMLVASFMLDDWKGCMEKIQTEARSQDSPKAVLGCIYRELRGFMDKYAALFQDESAGVSFAAAFPQRHGQLREQIAAPLKNICQTQGKADADFLAEFTAESMLTWTMAGRSFEEVSSILLQLF